VEVGGIARQLTFDRQRVFMQRTEKVFELESERLTFRASDGATGSLDFVGGPVNHLLGFAGRGGGGCPLGEGGFKHSEVLQSFRPENFAQALG
jgi:hypothetical protein